MQVVLSNNIIDVVIEYKNNKNLYIRFKDDLKMYVTCNRLFSEKKILEVINKNEKSLIRMYNKIKERVKDEEFYYYLGNKYTVIFDESVKKYKIDDDLIFVKDKKMLDKFYKDACVKVLQDRLDKMALLFDNIPNYKLRIRKMSTRWGVNNRGNNIITLNSELIKKDVTLIDYVCVHELAHFYEANHSSRFWKEVEKRYPYYKEARKRLNNGNN